MIAELTKTQELFLTELNNSNVICMSMVQLQEKYSEIASDDNPNGVSKASIKRNIEELVANGMVKRYHYKVVNNGRITSKIFYKL